MICSSSESVPLKSNAIARGRVLIGRPSYAALAVPAFAFELALAAAFLHAFWNLLLARARDPEGAAAVALVAAVIVFAPVTAGGWGAEAGGWPLIALASCLQPPSFLL